MQMLSTGIPELQSEDDIAYLRDAFALDLNDEQAEKQFYDKLIDALNTKSQVLADMAHILAHNK
jgi:phosphatidylinositol-4,5-bisphosphate 3-kinase